MKTTKPVAVLFARWDSPYFDFPCADVYDFERNALSFSGTCPVIAHPPCGQWSRLRKFAHKRTVVKSFALWSIDQVRTNGGILEHPAQSTLWAAANLPYPGQPPNEAGEFSIDIDQSWFGHRARKRTWLFISGISIRQLPRYGPNYLPYTHQVGGSVKSRLKHLTKPQRERTPPEFADFLIYCALLIAESKKSLHS